MAKAAVTSRLDCDVAVIGGGIVGLATAYKMARSHPTARIFVFEKETTPAFHQTGHNSGVIHSGIYYKPGSAKAKTCSAGRKELVQFAQEQGIPFKICGKVIVATEERELPQLERILQNGQANQIDGIERMDSDGIRRIEPACQGIAGIYVPCTGIIDFVRVAQVLAKLIEGGKAQNRVLTDHKVTALQHRTNTICVVTHQARVNAKYIINCAGLHSDRVARMDGLSPDIRVVPFRGDYYDLSPEASRNVRSLIYPVPDPRFPFLGVHYTRKIDGTVDCGPNAVFSFKREGYTKTAFSLRDAWSSLTFPGTWGLFMKNWRYGLNEYARVFSKRLFLRDLQRFIPSVSMADLSPGKAGVRAQAVNRRGEPVDDFRIERGQNAIHVLNAPSPAATACLAIGDHIDRLATEHFGV